MAKVKGKKPTVRVSPDLEVIHVSGGIGVGIDFDGISIVPLMTTIKVGEFEGAKPPIEPVIKYFISLPPHVAKLLVGMLDSAVKDYEKRYGEIRMPPEEE